MLLLDVFCGACMWLGLGEFHCQCILFYHESMSELIVVSIGAGEWRRNSATVKDYYYYGLRITKSKIEVCFPILGQLQTLIFSDSASSPFFDINLCADWWHHDTQWWKFLVGLWILRPWQASFLLILVRISSILSIHPCFIYNLSSRVCQEGYSYL